MTHQDYSEAASPPPSLLPQGALCAVHETTLATFVCVRCGSFACNDCYAVHTDAGPACGACSRIVAEELVPWDAGEKYGWFRAFWLTMKHASFTPTRFFRGVALGRRWKRPLVYAVLASCLSISIQTAIQEGVRALIPERGPSPFQQMFGVDERTVSLSIAALSLLFSPVTLAVSAGLVHLMLRVMREARASYEHTLRALCYSQGAYLWPVLVPFVGPYLGIVWLIVVQVIAIRETHRTTIGQSIIALLMPGFLFAIVLGVCVLGLVIAMVVGALGTAL